MTHDFDIQTYIEVHAPEEDVFRRGPLQCEADPASLWFLVSLGSTSTSRQLRGSLAPRWLEDQPDELRTELIVLFDKFLDSLTQPLSSTPQGQQSPQPGSSRRQQELQWIDENRSQVEKLAGNWIAVEGNQLIAYSPDFSTVLAETKRCGIGTPFIVFVPEPVTGETVNL